ncbi:hypothetical protein B7463_g10263, partial [Scytalidium lignicola]
MPLRAKVNFPASMSSQPPGVVIITGGADGFGAAIADRFSKEGYKVIIIDINRAKGEEKAKTDPNIYFMSGDVTQRETWEKALSVAQTEYGRIDVVVNNAGITYDPSPVHTKTIDLYEKVFNLNVKVKMSLPVLVLALTSHKPIFLSAQVIAPVMLEQGNGAFVNITRLKNSIGDDSQSSERLRKLEETLPMRRITQPSDIANAAWYLASDQSSFVTGTTLEVDGGRGV